LQETLRLRGEPADKGRVDAFIQAVDRECARVLAKPDIAAAEAVRSLASTAIDRAKKYGPVLAYTPGT
jgi:hypothetical protein